MAKQKEIPPSQPGKMTIMVFQLEGNDATLQQGIRTVQEAIGRVIPTAALISRPHLPVNPSAPALAPPVLDGEDDPQRVLDFGAEPIIVDEATPVTPAASKPAKDRKNPVMEFVKNLDLHPADKQSLKAFVEVKKPANQLEAITVCIYYLCRILELKNVTAHHVYTCLKHVGKKTPNDLPQTLRNIDKRKGYIDASNGDDVKITNPGDNFVEHSLPHTA